MSGLRKNSKTSEPFVEVGRLFRGYGFDGVSFGKAIGKSSSTGKRRLDHPEELTLAELMSACRNGKVPADEIREVIKFDY